MQLQMFKDIANKRQKCPHNTPHGISRFKVSQNKQNLMYKSPNTLNYPNAVLIVTS